MTEKLLYRDPYLKECDAAVAIIEKCNVVLDKTVFFAFCGGQAGDSGTIGGIEVKEAAITGADIIYTLDSTPGFSEGSSVKVAINWEKRHKIMKLHSAVHAADYIAGKHMGEPKRIGSNIDEIKGRLDYEYPSNIAPLLPVIEAETNELLAKNLEIKRWNDEANPAIMLWQLAD